MIALLAGVAGLLVGFWWGRKQQGRSESGQMQSLAESHTRAQKALEACRKQLETANSMAVQADIPFDYRAAKAVFGSTVKQDDLKLIDGIGPKIEGLFHNYDIKTWRALAGTSVAKCQEVLDSGGDRYKIHDPSSWPMQARMAYEGKWKELMRWQDEHDHGKL